MTVLGVGGDNIQTFRKPTRRENPPPENCRKSLWKISVKNFGENQRQALSIHAKSRASFARALFRRTSTGVNASRPRRGASECRTRSHRAAVIHQQENAAPAAPKKRELYAHGIVFRQADIYAICPHSRTIAHRLPPQPTHRAITGQPYHSRSAASPTLPAPMPLA